MVYVIKANGEKTSFEKQKIIGTCLRSGVSKKQAEVIASEVESKVREGMRTRDILKMVLNKLDALETGHGEKYRLKEAIAALDPEYHEFEKYITHLLRAQGYATKWNQIVQGEVIEHQVDVIAEKAGKRFLVECKHHRNPHRMTGLDVPLTYWAVLNDVQRGFEKGVTKQRFDNMWLVTNTKFSMHAIKYAKAKHLILSGWGQPQKNDLREIISKKKLYPLTILRLSEADLSALSRAGYLLLSEVATAEENEIQRSTGLSKKRVSDIINKTKSILG
ncbi:MAG: restriction endonuclease [archaeon]